MPPTHDAFARHIEAARRRLDALKARAQESADLRPVLTDALESISGALEEL